MFRPTHLFSLLTLLAACLLLPAYRLAHFITTKPVVTFTRQAVINNPVVTDLTICFVSLLGTRSCELDPQIWYPIKKDLYQYSSRRSAWLYAALAEAKQLDRQSLVVTDIAVREQPSDTGSGLWESRPGGIWLQRNTFAGKVDQVVTKVDVLFGTDAVDPRPQWMLNRVPLEINGSPKWPTARISILRGKETATQNPPDPLRVNSDGKFKILQISDTHMVTGVGVCKDAIDGEGKHLPASEADTLTVGFMKQVLDLEKPDLVVFTGDQLHHDISDSQSALLKVVAPVIERSIPFAAVFGNHDSEGDHALSRMEQMSILKKLPFSLCEAGPDGVDGVGNFYLPLFAHHESQKPLAMLYFLDSHGQIPSKIRNPDYDPIKPSQIEWFSNTSQAQRGARDGKGGISLVFQHIPIPEYRDSKLETYYGQRHEPTECPTSNSYFHEALIKEGVSAMICGHDHVNDFCGLLPTQPKPGEDHVTKPRTGPWLCYGGGSGYGGYCSYGRKRYHRRMRVWELEPSVGVLKTWKRLEYAVDPVDEVVLVRDGMIVEPLREQKQDRTCVVS